jgi:chromosome partitioning protein
LTQILMTSPVLTLAGSKGGTTKSASVATLGDVLSSLGLRVALVDADPQGTLTLRSGHHRVPDPLVAEPVSLAAPGATVMLYRGGRSLETADEGSVKLHVGRALAAGADLVILDTPPALGPILRAALASARLVVIPVLPGAESLAGYGDIRHTARTIAPASRVRALLAMVAPRTSVARWTRSQFSAHYPGALYETAIPHSVAAVESAIAQLPVTRYAPRTRVADAYTRLAAEIATDLGIPVAPMQLHLPVPGAGAHA